ncbi:MAG: diguanylate cyclase [Deltaproteobacteria bacterium]|nr:MAG: diguanylate cyclase [Deltaproteobacteria bacterium]
MPPCATGTSSRSPTVSRWTSSPPSPPSKATPTNSWQPSGPLHDAVVTAMPIFAPDLPPPADHTILIVDDDPTAAASIAGVVEELGYRVEVAHSWVCALEKFSAGSIDLVLMDAVMPGVDGFKLTALLRARARSYTPVVFLTGLTDPRARQLGLSAGADDFIGKPVDPFELRVRIGAMLRIRVLTKALEEKTQRLARMAHVDVLTGLGNRRAFDEEFPREVTRAVQFALDLSVCIFDIDHFKTVNDRFGHRTGDRVLSVMGRVLARGIRGCDRAYRLGGEEFVLLAPETGAEDCRTVADRLRNDFRRACASVLPDRPCTVSAGVASLAGVGLEAAEPRALLAAADDALYRAKTLGRDRCVVAAAANDAVLEEAAGATVGRSD